MDKIENFLPAPYSVEQLLEMLEHVNLPTATLVGFDESSINVYEGDVLEGVFKLTTHLEVVPDWSVNPLVDSVYATMMELMFENIAKFIFNKKEIV